jgi:hypothetical protein
MKTRGKPKRFWTGEAKQNNQEQHFEEGIVMNHTADNVEEKMASEKDKYVEKRARQIDKLNAELVELETDISMADLESKARREHEKTIADLRQQRDEAKVKLAEIQAAGDTKWEEVKDGLENVWTSIKHGVEKVKAKF